MSDSVRICMAHPNPGPECETFIQALVDRLPGVCEVLYGGHMPCFNGKGDFLGDGERCALPPEFSPDGIPCNPAQRERYDQVLTHLEKLAPDVVLAEYGPTGVALMDVCKELSIPLVVKFHGYDSFLTPVVEKYRAGYSRLFEYVSAVVTVSKHQAKAVTALGALQEKMHVIPTGVDTERFCGGAPDAVPPHFVSVGRFVDKKAPESLLLSFSTLADSIPEVRLTMVGDGVLHETCTRLATGLGLADKVDFVGRVNHDTVVEIMRKARCFVQHSVTSASGDQEGTPNAILEAMATGLPVIATRHGGISDAVIHRQTGLLCEEGDVSAMAQNMSTMALDPEKAARMGQTGRKQAQELHEMSFMTNKLFRLLERVTEKKS